MTAKKPVHYEETTSSEYAELAANSFSVERLGDGSIILRGRCPRCGGLMTFVDVGKVFRREGKPRATPALAVPDGDTGSLPGSAGSKTVVVLCTVQEEYEGRPPDGVGCGAYWALII